MTDTTIPKFIFDFKKLIETFTEICADFSNEPSYENATTSRRFAEQVIFELSKQVKVAKHLGKNQTWKLTLVSKCERGETLNYRVIISKYAKNAPPPKQPVVKDGSLELTFKEASLLAVAKYCQVVPHLVLRNSIVLTPLAGAVFSKYVLPALATALGEPLTKLVMAIISSCQTDGYYLEHSRCEIAVAALIKTVANPKLRTTFVKDTIRMYKIHGKEFDMDKFQICSKFVESNRPSSDDIDQLVSEILAFNMAN